MTKNETLHPQDARTKAILNRNIKLRQRDELRSMHSRVWSDANFIEDRDARSRTMGRHRTRPTETSTELICAL